MSQHSHTSESGSVGEVFLTFLKLGCTSFGGPIAHLGYFRKELVEKRQWVSESQYAQLLAICQFLPGPASSQAGFSLGYTRAGWPGALAAFVAFTLPSALLLLAFAALLPLLSGPVGQAALHGLKIVAFAVVADAVLGMARKLTPDIQRGAIALGAAALLILFSSAWLQVLVVLGGAIAGMLMCKPAAADSAAAFTVRYGTRTGTILLVVFGALLLGLPLLMLQGGSLISLAEAFYRAGALVFGGGHVVLPLLEDSLVATGWVSNEDFLAGYGAAQAIPGPMFAFSAYLGAVIPTGQPGWVGAGIALLFMFLPGFLLVAGVLPFWQAVAHNAVAGKAIAGVNAAVVGLLAAALYDPIFKAAIQNVFDLIIGGIGFAMLAVWRLSPLAAVGWCSIATVLVAVV